MAEPAKRAWSFLLITVGVGIVTAAVASSQISDSSVRALFMIAAACFSLAAYLLGAFKAPFVIGTLPRAAIVLGFIWSGTFVFYKVVAPCPKITYLETFVQLDTQQGQPIFANVTFQNIGARGKATIYSYSAVTPPDVDPTEIKMQLQKGLQQLVHDSGGLTHTLDAQDKKWFTIFGPILTTEQSTLLKGGKMWFFFSATAVTDSWSSEPSDYCSYVVGNRPKVVLQCNEK